MTNADAYILFQLGKEDDVYKSSKTRINQIKYCDKSNEIFIYI